MPEPLLHFAIPFALSAPILGIKRAMIVGVVSMLPDIDALFHVHRSVSHSIIILSIMTLLAVLLSLKFGGDTGLVAASGLGLLSHPLIDSFQSPAPILYPLSSFSYHVSPNLLVTISDRISANLVIAIEREPVNFTHFQSLDAPIFTDMGFIISLLLVGVPIIYAAYAHRGESSITALSKPLAEVKGLPNPLLSCELSDNGTISPGDVTILIPTLNEEEAIGKVIQELKSHGYRNILVVDGYSTDRTVEIAEKKGAKVIYQVGHGKAAAVKTGLEKVRTPYVLIMDGDGTYDPKDIEKLLRAAAEHGLDEVIGYRVNRENIPLLNRIGNKVISLLLSLLMGQRIKDPCSGMYLLRTDMARNLEITATGFDIEVEIVAQMLALGNVAEVPINYRKRIGRSKLSSLRAGCRIVWTAFKLGWLYNPVFMFTAIGSVLGLAGVIIMAWQLAIRYLYGAQAWSPGWAFFALTLMIIGLQALTVAIISLLLKRMERRMIRLYRRCS